MKLVLLPGMDGTCLLFEQFLEQLPPSLPFQTIQLPSKGEQDYFTLASYVKTKLPNEEYVLLAKSFSGPIAAILAKDNPKNLKGIIFVASFLNAPRRKLLSLAKYVPYALVVSRLGWFFSCRWILLGKSERVVGLKIKEALKTIPPLLLQQRLFALEKINIQMEPKEIYAVYIQATEDRLVPRSSVDFVKKFFPELKVFKVEGPHFILQTKPIECAHILKKLMNQFTTF